MLFAIFSFVIPLCLYDLSNSLTLTKIESYYQVYLKSYHDHLFSHWNMVIPMERWSAVEYPREEHRAAIRMDTHVPRETTTVEYIL